MVSQMHDQMALLGNELRDRELLLAAYLDNTVLYCCCEVILWQCCADAAAAE